MSSSKSSKEKSENGNTKHSQISPARHWCFTLNNYTEEDIISLKNISSTVPVKYIFQKEKGENGTPHLQGYMGFDTKLRPLSLKLNKAIHWEKCRNIEASINYCQKGDTRDGELYTNIKQKRLPKKLLLEQLKPFQREILDLHLTEPNGRNIYWFWSDEGNIGKSGIVNYLIDNYPDEVVFFQKGKYEDLMHTIGETNMDYVKTIIWDLPRENTGHICNMGVEAILDGRIRSHKYEGAWKRFAPLHCIVLANCEPFNTSIMSKDRWVIKEITVEAQAPDQQNDPHNV